MLSSGNVFSYQRIIKNEIGIMFLPKKYLTRLINMYCIQSLMTTQPEEGSRFLRKCGK